MCCEFPFPSWGKKYVVIAVQGLFCDGRGRYCVLGCNRVFMSGIFS